MKKTVPLFMFVYLMLVGFFILPLCAQLQPSSPWPMFQQNAMHTGQSSFQGSDSGKLVWSYETGDALYSSPAIGSDARIYVGSDDNRLYTLTSGGSFVWSYRTGHYVDSSPTIGSDGRVYAGSADNRFYGLLPDGSLLWSYETLDHTAYFSSPAISSDGRVYAGSRDNRLYTLTSTGSIAWSYETGDNVYSSPAIGAEGRVYMGSYDNSIYGLLSDGSLLWSYETEKDIDYSSPAIGSDGRVYIESNDNRLYVFEGPPTATPTVTPTSTPTPQAEIILNGSSFSRDEQFTATFQLNESITRPFTAYAVVVLPNGSMLNALTLDRPLEPVATNVPRLTVTDGPFTYPLINTLIPGGAPLGNYEVVAAFFDPTKPITGRADAFLEASGPFSIKQ
jgi:hypothetical protein